MRSDAQAPGEAGSEDDLAVWRHDSAAFGPNFLLIARLTLFVVLLHGGDGWFVTLPITLLALIGFLHRRALVDPLFWTAITVVLAHGNYLNWTQHDNHQFLINYWCLAISCCLWARNPGMLSAVARSLIGLAMLLAVIWKAVSPDYLDGTHFEWALLNDVRFAPAATFFGGVHAEILDENLARWLAFTGPSSAVGSIPFEGGETVRPLALALSWWGLGVEAMLAVLYLLPRKYGITRASDTILLIFIFTTYPIANVVGFGWILCVLGLAQCPPHARKTRIAFLVAFVAVFFFKAPISAYFRSVAGISLPFNN